MQILLYLILFNLIFSTSLAFVVVILRSCGYIFRSKSDERKFKLRSHQQAYVDAILTVVIVTAMCIGIQHLRGIVY